VAEGSVVLSPETRGAANLAPKASGSLLRRKK
jgi:hypothetical protein